MNATVDPNLIAVIPSEHDGEKRLTVDIPDGWDDCKKICKRVLQFGGEHYVFTGWNSDTNKCFFIQTRNVATIGQRIRK